MATTTKTTNLTELEQQVLFAILKSDYMSGDFPINKPIWYLDASDVNMEAKQLAGAIASCSKKQFVTLDKSSKNRNDHTIALTELGYDTLMHTVGTTNAVLYRKLREYNVIQPTEADYYWYNKLLNSASLNDLLNSTDAELKHTFINALFTTASKDFALFSKIQDANGHDVWTKFRPAKRFSKLDEDGILISYVKIDISEATYDDDMVVTPEKYKKTVEYSYRQFFALFSQIHFVSTNSPFFNSTIK